jgi:FSR family fosmidomycin resistance protein-like MFS transporter
VRFVSDPTVRPTILFLNVGHSFAHLFMLIFPTAVLAIEGSWGMGYAELLPLGFAGYLLFGLGSLPAGWLGDRWDSGWMIALFFLGTGAASMLTGLASSPIGLALGLTLIGVFASIYHPVGIAWLVGASDKPGRILGVNGVFGAAGVGGAALLTGLIADGIGWRAAFILPGAVCLLVGIAFTICLARGRLRMVRTDYRRTAGENDPGTARRGLFLLFGSILFAGLIFQMTSVGMPKIFQNRLGDVIGDGAAAAGLLVSVVYGISALGQLVGGYLADRFDERWLYACSYGVQVVILSLAAVTFDPTLVFLIALAATVQTGTQPVENCLIAKYTPDSMRATVYGLKFVLALGLSSLGVPLVAWIYGASASFTGVFLVMAAFAVVPVAVGLMLPGRTPAGAVAATPAE